MANFAKSVETFVREADWLTEVDEPAITALREIAEELDTAGVSAALVNVFTVTHRALLKKGQKGTEDFDDDEDFLNGL